MSDYVVEPIDQTRFLMPAVLRRKGTEPVVCLVNPSDRFRLVKKGSEIGRAYPINEVIEDQENILVQNVQEANQQEGDPSSHGEGDIMPEHLQELYSSSCANLSEEQKCQLAQLLIEFQDVFAKDQFDLGDFHDIEHTIDTGNARPVMHRIRRTPVCFAGEEEEHLQKMLKAGVIQESISDWASAPVLIRKRDGTVRWCIDYRALNLVTVKDVYPLPLVDDCLDTLAGSVWFSKLDANSAYFQVRVKEEDRKKTAFITKYGLFEHVRMGFGLCGAPATFARAMNLILRGLNWKTVLAFLDDVVVLGKDFNDHLANLREAFERFRKHGLKLKPKKCTFFQKEVEFLGRQVSSNSLAMSDQDVAVVKEWPVPDCAKKVERFMGLVNYHRGFIKNFSKIATPLYAVTGKQAFVWGQEQAEAFATLKERLTTPPVLALPNQNDSFILDTDASDYAIGAELIQVQGGKEKVIAYGSFALTKEQRRYCVTRKELLAVVRFTRQFRHYLLGKPFVVRTDHSSLRWLMNFREPQGQLARWLEELSQYNMVLQHRAGREHLNADALSRVTLNSETCEALRAGIRPGQLPCRGCKYCVTAHERWEPFFAEVDEAVPLVTCNKRHTLLVVKQQGGAVIRSQEGTGEIVYGEDESLDSRSGEASERGCAARAVELDSNKCLSEDRIFSTVKGSELPESSDDSIWMDGIVDPGDLARASSALEEIPWESSVISHEDCIASVNLVATRASKGATSDSAQHSQVVSDNSSASSSNSWGFSIADLKEAQGQDSDLGLVLDWLGRKLEPDPSALFRASPSTKSYWLNKELLTLIDGVLYQCDKHSEEKRLVLPVGLRGKALEWNHDLPSAGHQGESRTRDRMREKFTWFGMGKDVSNYVAGCAQCNQNKGTTRQGKCRMTEYQAGAPMERVHIDFLGPLPKSPRGNEYVLMIVDQFTKWVECIPVPNQSAEETARAAVDGFFARFGTPFQIFSDQGRNFESKLFTELCRVLEIHKARTTPYRPSSNGQVERYNRTLMDAVRCFIGKSQKQWDLHLQQIAGALRSSVNRMTGFTANMMMLGREVNTPAGLMFPCKAVERQTTEVYTRELLSIMEKAHETARQVMKATSKRMKRNYDLRILERTYQVGDPVYLLDTAVTKGRCKKLSPLWKGPGVIVAKLSAFIFRVKLRNSVFVANHDRLKLCRDREIPQWIKMWKRNPDDAVLKPARGDDRVYCIAGSHGSVAL